jgi:ATP-dependent Clp protease ATP-binding subunit ClpC
VIDDDAANRHWFTLSTPAWGRYGRKAWLNGDVRHRNEAGVTLSGSATPAVLEESPGYVGYEEAGQITEAVRRKPYSVVLLDEIEKAHPDVFNLLLQILDDGRLTDAQGRTVDFKNTVVIMTSNLGAERIQAHARRNEDFEELKEDLMQLLRSHFRPEFLNRIDEIIVFRALTKEQVIQIAELLLDRVRRRLRAQRIELTFTPDAEAFIADRGYDPEFGARPLQRTIQRLVENPLSRMLLDGAIREGDAVTVGVVDGGLDFDVRRPAGSEKKDEKSRKDGKSDEEKELVADEG